MFEGVDKSRNKVIGTAIVVVALAMAVYQMISTRTLFVDPLEHQNIHLGFALTLIFLVVAASSRKRWEQILWLAIVGVSLVGVVYVGTHYIELALRRGVPEVADVVIGGLLLTLVLVAAYRMYGKTLPILCSLFLVYALVGDRLPEPWLTFDFKPKELIFLITTSFNDGMYGMLLGISANFLFLFVLFGALLQTSGAPRFFMEVARLVGRRLRGGAGLSAVITSALMGTTTGSIAANIVTTGSFTIPLMKKAGYKPYQAAAIEATASTGGMIMPPIMSSTAFVMSGWTGIPYIQIIAMAAIPAVLYFFSAGLYVQFQAMKMKIAPMSETKVDYREMLLTAHLFLIPLGVIIVLLMQHFSLGFVAFWAIVSIFALSFLRKKTRPSLKQWVEGIAAGAKIGAQIAIIVALIGVATGVLIHTGLGVKLPAMVETWSGGNLYLALGITAIISVIIGMGLPTLAVYVLVAIAAAPALIRMGVVMEQAHLFVLYYGVVGMITPPVALGSLFAAKVANTPYQRTALESTKVGLAGFLVPFFFFLAPVILLRPQSPLLAAMGLIAVVLTLTSFQIGICAQYFTPLNRLERWLPIAIGIILILSLAMESYLLFAIGFVLFAAMTFQQWRKRRMSLNTPNR